MQTQSRIDFDAQELDSAVFDLARQLMWKQTDPERTFYLRIAHIIDIFYIWSVAKKAPWNEYLYERLEKLSLPNSLELMIKVFFFVFTNEYFHNRTICNYLLSKYNIPRSNCNWNAINVAVNCEPIKFYDRFL